MAKRKIDNPNQMSLLAMIEHTQNQILAGSADAPGSLNQGRAVRVALYESIKTSGLDRWEIAARMSRLTDCEISKAMLDAWTAESKEGHRFPVEYAAAFCRVTGCGRLLEVVGQSIGLFAMQGPDALRVQRARLAEQRKALAAQEKEIERRIELWESRP